MRDYGPKKQEGDDTRRETDSPTPGEKGDGNEGPPDLSKESMPDRGEWKTEIDEAKKGNMDGTGGGGDGPPDLSKESMPDRGDWQKEIDAQKEQDQNKPEG